MGKRKEWQLSHKQEIAMSITNHLLKDDGVYFLVGGNWIRQDELDDPSAVERYWRLVSDFQPIHMEQDEEIIGVRKGNKGPVYQTKTKLVTKDMLKSDDDCRKVIDFLQTRLVFDV